jgi:hypothetical protein
LLPDDHLDSKASHARRIEILREALGQAGPERVAKLDRRKLIL